ncbi:GDSL-type esterase/lipase family protein [Demetria terragena]|uniref:GDSL-type esterase/lipase family protein n=1 Tax=Demetria terragena TaxID=63959 RepID=UPI00036205D3|nr:GDSL-type esterase/lipase family protein [Demetria terragena]
MSYPQYGSDPEFTPSAEFQIAEGDREVGLCFVGDSLVAGLGDPKALGWVSRVVARTQNSGAELRSYNLGVSGETSSDVLGRWHTETAPRWATCNERRLVIGFGTHDVMQGMTTARSRLNMANILDDASTSGIATFVVGPPPTSDHEINQRLEVLVDAQADVCARRRVTYVDCFRPLLGHDQWQSDLAAGDGFHPGQAGYGLIAWLVLHAGWQDWLSL